MKKLLFIPAYFILIITCGLLDAQKELPDNHTKALDGAVHGEGYRQPFNGKNACSECHGQDLKGGLAKLPSGERRKPF